MTPEAEKQARRRTCRFIEEAGQRSLRLPRVAVSTATVFFHRFYAKHAFQDHDRFEVAMACLLLAGKTEESPKKLELVIRECWKLRRRSQMQQLSQQAGGDSPMAVSSPSSTTMQQQGQASSSSLNEPNLDPNSEEYVRLKERVLLLERIILHTIGFELSIEHPYKFLVDCVQEKKRMLEYAKPPTVTSTSTTPSMALTSQSKSAQYAQMVQELAQNAMNFANDSMHTSLCLQYTAREIALTCVYLSGKYSGIRPVGNRPWIELLDGITVDDLTSISIQILELVQPRKGMDSEMALKNVRKDLDEMSKSGEMPDAKRSKTN
jgi:cyclin T